MPEQYPTRRSSMRHPDHDYRSPGAYFVTICAYRGHSIFGQIVDGKMVLNPMGEIALACWQAIPTHFPQVGLDESVIMPNHSHGVLWIDEQGVEWAVESSEALEHGTGTIYPRTGTIYRARTRIQGDSSRRFGESVAGSLSVIVGTFKAAVTRQAHKDGLIPGGPIWHRNFWDHIIRDAHALDRIRTYIRTNPARWVQDQLHPQAAPNQWNQFWSDE